MIPSALRKIANFLHLLLTTSKQQIKALFYTLIPLQTTGLCEIIFNLRKLPLTANVVRELKKRKSLFNKLVDKTITVRIKLELIQTHYRQIQATLQLVKKELISMLE